MNNESWILEGNDRRKKNIGTKFYSLENDDDKESRNVSFKETFLKNLQEMADKCNAKEKE